MVKSSCCSTFILLQRHSKSLGDVCRAAGCVRLVAKAQASMHYAMCTLAAEYLFQQVCIICTKPDAIQLA